MARSIEQLADEIRAYLDERPDAVDTAEGIARFWISADVAATQSALERLLTCGVLEEQISAGVRRYARAGASRSRMLAAVGYERDEA